MKIWFNTPRSWQASLGKRFWVKKQWSVSAESEAQVSCSIEDKKRHYMSRFLNKIRLYYIPAIKDRKIFESLQAEIYRVISQNVEFSGSLQNFSNALKDGTLGLSEQLLEDLNISSVVTTPKDLTDLFRSLDFETTSEAGDSYSLTLQRGDGVQVRHIAPILSFLAENSGEDFHIWAFEEPENSLELANAIEEAKRFRSFGLESNKQIFLTSHSPAFFSLDYEDISRYFITRSHTIENRLNSVISEIDSEDLPSELMGETPHLPVISAYLKEAHSKILQQQTDYLELGRVLDAHNQSIVFVEGESDVILLTKAWQVLMRQKMPFRFESCGGTTKMEGLSRDGKILSNIAPGRKIFALVDNDTEGRSLYETSRLKVKGRWVRHNSNNVYWCRLPFNEGFEQFMKQIGLPERMWPGSLENIFSPAIKQRAVELGELRINDCPHAEVIDKEHFGRIRPYLAPREDLSHFYLLTNHEDTKISFSKWLVTIVEEEPEIIEPLRIVFEGLLTCLAAGDD